MGKMFFEHMGGVKVYYCGSCLLNLTNQESLLSRHFHGETGRAFLFKKAVNYTEGCVQRRQMMTGVHHARDVFCKKCNTKIGWKYEFAEEESQRYKEGCLVIECAYMKESSPPHPNVRFGRRSLPRAGARNQDEEDRDG